MADILSEGGGYPDPDELSVLTVTASGSPQTIKASPGPGNSLYVLLLVVCNRGSKIAQVNIRDQALVRFSHVLAPDGGKYEIKFPPRGWQLRADKALRAEVIGMNPDVFITAMVYIAPE